MDNFKDGIFSIDVSVTILSGIVALYSLLPRQNRIKVSTFKLTGVWYIPLGAIFFIFIAKILPYLPFKVPSQWVVFLAYPIIYDSAAFLILLFYCWWCKTNLVGDVLYNQPKKKECYAFLSTCMDEGIAYEKIKPCLLGSIDDLLEDANRIKENSSQESNEYKACLLLKKIYSVYDNTCGEDIAFITKFVTKVNAIYENNYRLSFPFISSIIVKSFTEPESKLYLYVKRAKDLTTNPILSFLTSPFAAKAKQDLIILLHGKEYLFRKDNIDAYLNFIQLISECYFKDAKLRAHFDSNNDLRFYFEQYNSIMRFYLAKDGVTFYNFYTTFFRLAITDLNGISDVTYQIFERYYFEYIEVLYMTYKHDNDLIFMKYSQDLWLVLKENWVCKECVHFFKSLRDKIAQFNICNCHLLRYFFVCEVWEERQYEFIGKIWDVIKKNYAKWHEKNEYSASYCLPAWITYNSSTKTLEKHRLTGNTSEIISSFQCE